MVILISVFALILGILITYYISRLISKPVLQIASMSEKIAAGDLTGKDLKILNRDEIGILAKNFQEMKQSLQDILERVAISSSQVTTASDDLKVSSEQTKNAASLVAFALEEIATGRKGKHQKQPRQ